MLQVIFIRHSLQKTLLSGHYPPQADQRESLSYKVEQLEAKHSTLEREVLEQTKIHRVLLAIHFSVRPIPLDDVYDFKGRAAVLLRGWGVEVTREGLPEIPGVTVASNP